MVYKTILSLTVTLVLLSWAVGSSALEEPVLGDPEAPVTIIEFASLSCPHCAAFHKERFPWLKKHFLDTGKVKFIFKPIAKYQFNNKQ